MTATKTESPKPDEQFGLRQDAVDFPMMIILSIVYPCNFGCPNCPYTDGNSEIRSFYKERGGDRFPQELWNRIAKEAGPYGSWLRCTGGGEPMLHPQMVEMIEYAKTQKARVWLNTNGSMFGPQQKQRDKLRRIIESGIDLIEFSMDAGDPQTYNVVRPPLKGRVADVEQRWMDQVGNVRAALELRKEVRSTTRVVVSMIRQTIMEGKMEEAKDFWLNDVGVDEVITRKYLTWDANTSLDFDAALDPHLYADKPATGKSPCVWPFERLNIDTLGRVALCGQDIGFNTAHLFPNINDSTVQEIWKGEVFNWYRQKHLDGKGEQCNPCQGCSAWFAGIRDWDHGWLKVLRTSGEHLKKIMSEDLGVEVEVHQPDGSVSKPKD